MSAWKYEAEVGAHGLPGFLRELAAALESGQPGSGALAGLPGRDFRKLVLVAESTGGGVALKLKAKRAHELRVPTPRNARFATPDAPAPAGQAGRMAAQPAPTGKNAPKAADASARLREKYRQLKKALQADFKALHKAAEAGLMPAQDQLESFLALSESMVEMPPPHVGPSAGGHGPEAAELARANSVFLEDARALRRVVAARDAAALLELLSRLERRRSACHAQFR